MDSGESRCPVQHSKSPNADTPSECPMNKAPAQCPVNQAPSRCPANKALTKCPINQAPSQCPASKTSAGGDVPSRKMKAVRVNEIGGPEKMVLEQVAVPVPGDDQIVVRLFTIGVNPCDILYREQSGLLRKDPPFTLGEDGAGIVDVVGKNVTKFQVGERVYVSHSLSGTYAEFCLTTPDWTHRLHDNLSFSQAAGLPVPYVTAYMALVMAGNARPGQTVLIHGASGGVGLACCQMARAYGLQVVGTAGTARGLTIVKQSGAHIAVNHREEGYVQYLKAVTKDEGYHLILEMAADKNLQNDLTLLRDKGTVVVIGSNGKIEIDPALMLMPRTTIKGVQASIQEPEDSAEIFAALYCGMQQGWLQPVIDTEFPLTEVAEAHRYLADQTRGRYGNVILSIV